MPLESATTIDQLVITNPVATDPLAEADDHIRLIKAALKATFPSLVGSTSVTKASLDALATALTRLTTVEANRARLDIDNVFLGNQQVNGSVNSTGGIHQGGNLLVPPGVIVMWSGLTTNIPAGWKLCDGSNGTPDLRNKFIMGAGTGSGGSQVAGTTGGATSQTVSTDQQGAVGVATTSSSGAHNHTGTTGAYALTVADIPSHTHTASVSDPGHAHVNNNGFGTYTSLGIGGPEGYGQMSATTTTSLTAISVTNTPTGGGAAHSHTIALDGAHVHTVPAIPAHGHAVTVATVPPYMALCYIMKT